MYQETITLCGSNGYEKKYYLNEDHRNVIFIFEDMQRDRADLWESLELFFRVFFLGEEV